MRTAACALLLALPATAFSQDKPPKWEYGALTASGPSRGGPGGPGPNRNRFVWVTGTEDVAAESWKELAEKLKVEVKDAPAPRVRVLVLNHLGSRGWELVAQQADGPIQSYTFKRRVP